MSAHDRIKREKWERLNRFVQAVSQGKKPDHEALGAGIDAVIEKMDELKSRQGRQKPVFTVDSPQFGIAQEYAAGRISQAQAIDLLLDTGCAKSRTTARQYLLEMEPRAKRAIDFLARLRDRAERDNSSK